MEKVIYRCSNCGDVDHVTRRRIAFWDAPQQRWVDEDFRDDMQCGCCGGGEIVAAQYFPTHPDYDNAERFNRLLELCRPFGGKDTSWRNDICPSIGRDGIRLWIDYRAPQSRELDCAEFCVTIEDENGCVVSDQDFSDLNDAARAFALASMFGLAEADQ